MSQGQIPFRNRLLNGLSPSALAKLGPLQFVDLELRASLEVAGEPITHAYFMEQGFASVVAEVEGIGAIEVGLIGHEGVTGIALIHDDTQSPFQTFIQGAGNGYRIDAAQLRAAMDEDAEICRTLLRFTRSFHIQVASTAFANGHVKLEARLARWLLMVGDRLGPSFRLTHEFLSIMLAVRRSGVTVALQTLEGRGFIRSTRGSVDILDRDGLVAHTGGAYGLAEREYERLLGKAT